MTSPSFTIAELAARTNGRATGDETTRISGLASLTDASPGDLTFIGKSQYAEQWPKSRASAAVVQDGLTIAHNGRPLITVKNVEQAMIVLLEAFAPPQELPALGTHDSAVIDKTARIGKNVRIGPHVSIGPGSVIGDDVSLFAGACIGSEVRIGDRSVLHANVVVRERCEIGRDVIIHANSSVGADGFGYRPSSDGRRLLKMPHIGNVVIGDDVEIGAGTCIDRAKFGSTTIGAGTKIDNLCQIAHGVQVGRGCVIAGQTGLAGSCRVGDGCLIGGGVRIVDHVVVGSNVQIGGGSGVVDDVADGRKVLGVPAEDARDTLRMWALIRKLPALFRDFAHLQRRIDGSETHRAD